MKRKLLFASSALVTCLGIGALLGAGGGDSALLYWLRGWPGYAYNSQHLGLSPTASQPLLNIHWQTSVDLQPPGGGIHGCGGST